MESTKTAAVVPCRYLPAPLYTGSTLHHLYNFPHAGRAFETPGHMHRCMHVSQLTIEGSVTLQDILSLLLSFPKVLRRHKRRHDREQLPAHSSDEDRVLAPSSASQVRPAPEGLYPTSYLRPSCRQTPMCSLQMAAHLLAYFTKTRVSAVRFVCLLIRAS